MIKVLPLSFPFSFEEELWEDCVKPEDKIEPIFNRNGYYLNRQSGLTWLEINGKAWKYQNREAFEYEIAINIGNNFLDDDTYEALKILIKRRLATKHQKKIYYYNRDKIDIRKTYRDAQLNAFKMVKRIKQKINGDNDG